MLLKICVILLVQTFAFGKVITNYEDEIDDVINLLLNDDGDVDIETDKPEIDKEADQPVFSDGVWKCGSCDVIDESKLIQTEEYEVATNDISDDRPIIVQVGLSLDNMQCVTVTAVSGSETVVRRESGACAGQAVTLAVRNAREFLVHVY